MTIERQFVITVERRLYNPAPTRTCIKTICFPQIKQTKQKERKKNLLEQDLNKAVSIRPDVRLQAFLSQVCFW